MKNNNYKLIGIINYFGIYPDFLYPIFEKDGKYYLAYSANNTITHFKEISEKLHKKMICFFNQEFNNIKQEYTIGDESIIAFQIDKNNLIISTVSNFIPFISNFETEDHILKEKIDELLNQVTSKKSTIKKKEKIKD